MFKLIYRQRRRIIFSSVFMTTGLMALAIGMLGPGFYAEETQFLVLATVLMAAFVFICTISSVCAFVVLLPRWRSICEQVGILVVAMAAIYAAFPGLHDIQHVSWIMPFFLIIGIGSLLYGPALDRFRLWVDHKETRRFRSEKTAKELWAQLLPDTSNIDGHWDPLLYSMDPVDEEDDAYEVEYQLGHSTYEHQTITFLEKDYPHHFRYHHLGEVDPKNRSLVEGIHDVTIEPDSNGTGSIVTISEHRNAMLPRVGLSMWFDDDLGSRTDFFRARETGRRDWSTAGKIRREIMALA